MLSQKFKPSTNDNNLVSQLTVQIEAAKFELMKMQNVNMENQKQYAVVTDYIKTVDERIKNLKSSKTKIVDIGEFRELRRCQQMAYNSEDTLRQNLEMLEICMEQCTKEISRLENLREASQFQLLEFKHSGTRHQAG